MSYQGPPQGGHHQQPYPPQYGYGPPRRRSVFPMVLLGLLALGGFGAAGFFYVQSQDDDVESLSGIADADDDVLVLEPADFAGEDPFSEVSFAVDPDPAIATPSKPLGEATTVDLSNIAPVDAATSVGLYGGSGEQVCFPEKIADFLGSNPEKAKAWVDAFNNDPSFRWNGGALNVAEIPDFLMSLTSQVLAVDTLVTNHGFKNGVANEVNSLLQRGTAVLVDASGVPRVKCNCGNPLKPPKDLGEVKLTGKTWTGGPGDGGGGGGGIGKPGPPDPKCTDLRKDLKTANDFSLGDAASLQIISDAEDALKAANCDKTTSVVTTTGAPPPTTSPPTATVPNTAPAVVPPTTVAGDTPDIFVTPPAGSGCRDLASPAAPGDLILFDRSTSGVASVSVDGGQSAAPSGSPFAVRGATATITTNAGATQKIDIPAAGGCFNLSEEGAWNQDPSQDFCAVGPAAGADATVIVSRDSDTAKLDRINYKLTNPDGSVADEGVLRRHDYARRWFGDAGSTLTLDYGGQTVRYDLVGGTFDCLKASASGLVQAP